MQSNAIEPNLKTKALETIFVATDGINLNGTKASVKASDRTVNALAKDANTKAEEVIFEELVGKSKFVRLE